jgi:hypothetical protein
MPTVKTESNAMPDGCDNKQCIDFARRILVRRVQVTRSSTGTTGVVA